MSPSWRLLAAVLLTTAWLGAAVLTVAVVAPRSFAVLPRMEMPSVPSPVGLERFTIHVVEEF